MFTTIVLLYGLGLLILCAFMWGTQSVDIGGTTSRSTAERNNQ